MDISRDAGSIPAASTFGHRTIRCLFFVAVYQKLKAHRDLHHRSSHGVVEWQACGNDGGPANCSYHAFMNQKIMPRSATRCVVTGVGKPARKYQSQPRCVRMPGVSVTLVGVPLPLMGLLATAET